MRMLSDLFTAEEMASKDRTSCNMRCSGCNELLVTEGDFYRHFTVIDPAYRNLGNCPNKQK